MLWESCCAGATDAGIPDDGAVDSTGDRALGGNGGEIPLRNGNVVDGEGEDSARGGSCTESCTS